MVTCVPSIYKSGYNVVCFFIGGLIYDPPQQVLEVEGICLNIA